MSTLVRFSVGRILLHVIAMLVDHSWRFHAEGIARELSFAPRMRAALERVRARLVSGWRAASLDLDLAQSRFE